MNAPTTKPTSKKRRNLPGMPDPEAEVIALSPKSLLATNRFLCEICNKGFQRDQNLQLHRRGHNLPWKLRQKSSNDVIKKRVYVCPETSCVHHDPTRALGDLTGIKKHFCRKHGEKKWKCEKCCKKYAVQSDWKAHSKVCGTKEYKCDCGTLFTRRDSFITHRAFCDALAQESVRAHLPSVVANEEPMETVAAPAVSPGASNSPVETNQEFPDSTSPNRTSTPVLEETLGLKNVSASCSGSSGSTSNGSSSSSAFASLFTSSTTSTSFQTQADGFNELLRSLARPDVARDIPSSKPISLGVSSNQRSFSQYAPSPSQASFSATALLQKAAQMGPAASDTSFLRGLGIMSSLSPPQEWHAGQIDTNRTSSGDGHGSRGNENSGLKELMFGPKRTTLDLLGSGMDADAGSPSGFLALMTSMTGGLDAAAIAPGFSGAKTWEETRDFV